MTLCGWIHSRRDHGGVVFCDLRDRTGLRPDRFPSGEADLFERAQDLGGEYVVEVTGKVAARPEGTRNPNIATGEVEIEVEVPRDSEHVQAPAV